MGVHLVGVRRVLAAAGSVGPPRSRPRPPLPMAARTAADQRLVGAVARASTGMPLPPHSSSTRRRGGGRPAAGRRRSRNASIAIRYAARPPPCAGATPPLRPSPTSAAHGTCVQPRRSTVTTSTWPLRCSEPRPPLPWPARRRRAAGVRQRRIAAAGSARRIEGMMPTRLTTNEPREALVDETLGTSSAPSTVCSRTRRAVSSQRSSKRWSTAFRSASIKRSGRAPAPRTSPRTGRSPRGVLDRQRPLLLAARRHEDAPVHGVEPGEIRQLAVLVRLERLVVRDLLRRERDAPFEPIPTV